MFLSIIIPTIGRKSLKRSVDSVLNQDFDHNDYEVIIIAQDFKPEKILGNIQHRNFTVLNTKRISIQIAMNSGAAIARGKYLYFIADDDWMLPGAIDGFHKLVQENPETAMIYGGCEFRDEDGTLLGSLNLGKTGNCLPYLITGAWIPTQSAIFHSDVFFQVGGFDPLSKIGEDDDFNCRLALQHDLMNTDLGIVGILRGKGWNTSFDYSLSVESLHRLRDQILNQPDAFDRLKDFEWEPYWMGRIYRVYLAAVVWNLRNRRFFKSFSRGLNALKWLYISKLLIFKKKFFQGLKDHYPPLSAASSFQ